MDKVKNLFKRKEATPSEGADAAPANKDAKPITLQLSKASPKLHATGANARVAIDPTQLAALRVRNLKVKYHSQFEHFKNYKGKAHPLDLRQKSAAAPTVGSNGTEPLTDQGGELLWSGTVGFGTPPQTFALDFDTGSSDVFCNPGNYDPSKASTSKELGRNFTVAYGDGTTASGPIYTDAFTVAGVTADNQALGAATKSTLTDDGSVGIAGMAFESIAQFKSPPFFQTMYSQGKVQQNLFCFGLWTEGARLDLGHIEKSAYTGSITYAKVDDSQGFWTTSFKVNNSSNQSGIIDTGTTLIIGPVSEVKALWKKLGVQTIEQQGEVYGVYDPKNPPKVTLTFNKKDFTLSDDALSFQPQGDQMIASLIGADIGLDGWIVGDSFLQDVYAVFDLGGKRVGFAPKAAAPSS